MAPLLPLDTFRKLMGFHPFHFWQLAGSTVPVNSECNDLVYQHPWQDADARSRSDIVQAIETAEARLREWLGYPIAPQYISATLSAPNYYATGITRYGYAGPDGQWLTVQLDDGFVQAIGTESLTLIGNANVTASDDDGDGVKESWVATIATTVTDATQIAAYFVAADRLDSADVGPDWRIRPVTVSISGGTATIRGKRWLLVKPIKFEGLAVTANILDATSDANYASSIAIYQRTTGNAGEATLIYDTDPYPGFCCATGASDSSSDPAAIATGTARMAINDSRRGIIHYGGAAYDATTGVWYSTACGGCVPPQRLQVNYLAGVPLVNGQVDPTWATIVARLAAAELARPICACESANRELGRWQFDLARTSGANDESYGAISAQDLNNPFGTRRGHVYAWRQVEHLRLMRGLFAG